MKIKKSNQKKIVHKKVEKLPFLNTVSQTLITCIIYRLNIFKKNSNTSVKVSEMSHIFVHHKEAQQTDAFTP